MRERLPQINKDYTLKYRPEYPEYAFSDTGSIQNQVYLNIKERKSETTEKKVAYFNIHATTNLKNTVNDVGFYLSAVDASMKVSVVIYFH